MRKFRLWGLILAAVFSAAAIPSLSRAQSSGGAQAGPGGEAGGGVESGIFGFAGARQGEGSEKGVIGECVWIYDSGNKTQVSKGDCDQGNFRVPLKPGRYVVRGPGGNQPVEVKDGRWVEVRSVVELPMMP